MVTKPKPATEETTKEETAPETEAATTQETPVATEEFKPQLMVANVAPTEAPAPKLIKVKVNIGTIEFEKGNFRCGAILEVTDDEYRRIKDYVTVIA